MSGRRASTARLLRREGETNATVIQRSVRMLEQSFGLSMHNVSVEISQLQRSTRGLDSKVLRQGEAIDQGRSNL